MRDRSVRSLVELERSASTARVLNLRAIHQRRGSTNSSGTPFFHNAGLNTSIIVKHRLRSNELDVFGGVRKSATKVIFPLDPTDLAAGARFLFVDQKNFLSMLENAFGNFSDEPTDLRTLRLLDELPSLDPFLLREQLKRHGIEPDLAYFEVSEADAARMSAFVRRELSQLLSLSFAIDDTTSSHAARFAEKLLSATVDADFEPLRATLQLNPREYSEGMFCWKAFLYYKWKLAELLPSAQSALLELMTVKPVGAQDADTRAYLAISREAIRRAVAGSLRSVRDILAEYDVAYAGLTQRQAPAEFRAFLLRAPSLFNALGEQLAGVDHLISFWRFRFPKGAKSGIPVEEMIDLLMDFSNGLGCEQGQVA